MYNYEIKEQDYDEVQELLKEIALNNANWAFIEAFEIKE